MASVHTVLIFFALVSLQFSLAGCDGVPMPGTGDAGPPTVARADTVVDAPGAGAGPFRDPSRAIDGVRGGGLGAGSLDVYSIDYGTHLVLSWGGRRVLDGPGVDLVVFENPFHYGDGLTFMDPAIVEVSVDGEAWVALPHEYAADDPSVYSARGADWRGFAGVTPVTLHEEHHPVDPFDVSAAGGDGFDLATLPDEGEAGRIRREGAALVRIRAAHDHVDPRTGARYPRDPVANGPDIDGVYARYVSAW